jgi:hypothetical protein
MKSDPIISDDCHSEGARARIFCVHKSLRATEESTHHRAWVAERTGLASFWGE